MLQNHLVLIFEGTNGTATAAITGFFCLRRLARETFLALKAGCYGCPTCGANVGVKDLFFSDHDPYTNINRIYIINNTGFNHSKPTRLAEKKRERAKMHKYQNVYKRSLI